MDTKATEFPQDKHARLAELGLSESLLLRAVGQGFMAWANCTENDHPTFPGYSFWAITLRVLREELLLAGWRKDDSGVPLVINEDGDTALMVASGDKGVGNQNRNVSTKRSRGPKTSEQVQVNGGQLRLFPVDGMELTSSQAATRHAWMLLYYHDSFGREIRCELSFPVRMDDDSRPDEWRERIILDSIPFDDISITPSIEDGPLEPDIEILVERRV